MPRCDAGGKSVTAARRAGGYLPVGTARVPHAHRRYFVGVTTIGIEKLVAKVTGSP